MDFEEILNQWDNSKKNQKNKEKIKKSSKQEQTMGDFLEMYPPDRDLQHKKEIPDRIIQHTRKKDYKKMDPQDSLDLHGWKSHEAIKVLENFLKLSQKKGLKKVIVVHGKGLHSPNGQSVLRPLVKKHLEHSPYVKDYGRAPIATGGGGATWIIIR